VSANYTPLRQTLTDWCTRLTVNKAGRSVPMLGWMTDAISLQLITG